MAETVLQRGLVVGLGGLGRHMIRQLASKPWYTTAALVDIHERALADAQREFGLPDHALFTNLESALAHSDATVAIINSPSEFHVAQVEAALAAGLHVLVAKPLALAYEPALALVELAEARGLLLAVGQQMRYMKHYRALRRFIESGVLGSIEMVYFLNAKPRPQASNLAHTSQPVLTDMSCHHFDTLFSLFPQHTPQTVLCAGAHPSWSVYTGPSMIVGEIAFDHNLHMLYHAGYSSQADCYELRLEGAGGALRCRGIHMSNDTMTYEFAEPGGAFQAYPIDDDLPPTSAWDMLLEQWQRYLAGGDAPPWSGRNNLKVMALLSAAIESVERGQRISVAGNPRFAAVDWRTSVPEQTMRDTC